jgi:hypothetical protein
MPQPISIDWDKVDRGLANLFSQRQIALWLGVDTRTLRDACKREKGIPWNEYAESQRSNTLAFIANRVIAEALNGDNALLLHLAKVHLGWNEKQQISLETQMPVINFIGGNIDTSKPQYLLGNGKLKEEDDRDGSGI